MYRLLSYHLKENTLLYGNTRPMSLYLKVKYSDKDISIRETRIDFPSHCGTHIDAYRHFCRNGKEISQFKIGRMAHKIFLKSSGYPAKAALLL